MMISISPSAMRTSTCQFIPKVTSIATAPTSSRWCIAAQVLNNTRTLSTTSRLLYATTTNPNPPLGKKNATNDVPSKIALIGARGYTGSAVVELLNNHANMDLRYVSSRELAGTELQGYGKRKIIYDNLSPEDLADLSSEIDCVILALPNGVCKPFVEALDQAQKGKDRQTVIVDLSADYRFNDSWVSFMMSLR